MYRRPNLLPQPKVIAYVPYLCNLVLRNPKEVHAGEAHGPVCRWYVRPGTRDRPAGDHQVTLGNDCLDLQPDVRKGGAETLRNCLLTCRARRRGAGRRSWRT